MDQDPDRYLVINGRRWRKSDPLIPTTLRSELVWELMSARRAVGTALKADDDAAEKLARSRVNDAKVSLGERGRPWWLPVVEEDLKNRMTSTIRTLLRKRGPDKTICPSDCARVCGGPEWRNVMSKVKDVAWELVEGGWLEVTQKAQRVKPNAKGPIRLRQARSTE